MNHTANSRFGASARFDFPLLFLFLLATILFFSARSNLSPMRVDAQQPQQNYLNFSRVHLQAVSQSNNFFFRGNMPKNTSQEFAYDELIQFMTKRALERQIDFPEDVYLFVLSLDSLFNQNDTNIEVNFFAANPKLGNFTNWPLYQYYPDPNYYTIQQIQNFVEKPNFFGTDDFPNRMIEFQTIFQSTADRPIALYVHCETGCDRTGEFSGNYMMQYQSITDIDNVISVDTIDCGRPPNYRSVFELQWYCFYLQYVLNMDMANCYPSNSN